MDKKISSSSKELLEEICQLASDQSSLKVRCGPSGIHTFNRSTGVNILFDEILPPLSLWAAAPRQVSIALTNACDLRCSYCFTHKNRASLDYVQVTNWLNELDANGCMGVGFGGGEPTLFPHFVELCQYTATKTRLAVTFTTNGHHLNEELISALKGNVHFIRVSMDGVGDTYEKLRGKQFDILLDRLHQVRYLAPFGINFVVNKITLPDLDAAKDIATSIGAAEFLLLPEQPVNGTGGIDGETSQALRSWVSCYHDAVPLTISEFGGDVLPRCNPFEKETDIQAYAHITATGVIKRTSFDLHGVTIGSDGVIGALRRL